LSRLSVFASFFNSADFVIIMSSILVGIVEQVELPFRLGLHVFRVFLRVLRRSPARLVPDNLRTGVARPDLYDPKINRPYAELAHHYRALVDPARRGAGNPRTNRGWSGRYRT